VTGGKLRFKKSYRDAFDAAAEEATLLGATVELEILGRKHPRVTVRLGSDERTFVFSSTPRTDNSASWARQRVRQKIREMETRPELRMG
jgi:hypothetical protein